jgi:UDP-N-acetylglucosamine--N-acetylmuramyl-(pentapeptide) pyrophosphoryl-undecaprenol N-acetylglucosamine transferase
VKSSTLRERHVAYFVHGRGRGHASRALSVVPALRHAGYGVSLFAAADALAVLRPLGPLSERPLLLRGPRGLAQLLGRARSEARLLHQRGVTALISDGDQAALLAARLSGVPALALGHDLAFQHCVLPVGLDRVQLLAQRMNGLIAAQWSTRRVAVSFLPTRSIDAATRVARPDAGALLADVARPRENLVLCYFRDGNGSAASNFARQTGAQVVVADGRGSTLEPASFRALLGRACAVIGSAGSNLIAECVLSSTPLLALHKRHDVEQALNASWLAAADVGMACRFERLDAALVAHFIARARARQFARVDLAQALPGVAQAVLTSLDELLAQADERPDTPAARIEEMART